MAESRSMMSEPSGVKESYFSFGDEEATVTLPYIPSWLQVQQTVMHSKLPMLHAPTGKITLFTTGLCEKLHFTPSDLEFDSSANEFFLEYKSLHDPYLKNLYNQARTVRRLIKQGYITPELKVKCSLEEFNIYHQYLKKMRLNRLNQKHKRQMEHEREQKLKEERKKKDRRVLSDRDKRGIAARERKQAKIKEEHQRLTRYLERDEMKRVKLLNEQRVKRGIEEAKKSIATEKRKQINRALEARECNRKAAILHKRSEKEERSTSRLREQRELRRQERERKLAAHWTKQERVRRKKMHDQTKKEERLKEKNRALIEKRKEAARRSLLRYQEGFLNIRDERAMKNQRREARIERALSCKLKQVAEKFDRRMRPSSRTVARPGTFPPITEGYLTRDTMWSLDDAIQAVPLDPAGGVWKYDPEKAKKAKIPSSPSTTSSTALPPIIVTTEVLAHEAPLEESTLSPVVEPMITEEAAPATGAAPDTAFEGPGDGIGGRVVADMLAGAGDDYDIAVKGLVADIFMDIAAENPEMVDIDLDDEVSRAADDDLYLDLIAEYDRRTTLRERAPDAAPVVRMFSGRQLSSGSCYSRLSEADVIRLRDEESTSPPMDIHQAAERVVRQSLLGAFFYLKTTEGLRTLSSVSSLQVEGRSGTKGSSASSMTVTPAGEYPTAISTAMGERLDRMESVSELMDQLPSSAAELRRMSLTGAAADAGFPSIDSSLLLTRSRSITEADTDAESDEEEELDDQEGEEEVIGIVENEIISKEKSSKDRISYPELSEVYREDRDGSLLVEGGISAKALEIPGKSVTETILSIESLRGRGSSSSSGSLHLNRSVTEGDAEGSGEATGSSGVQYHSVIPVVNKTLVALSDKIISKHLSFISSKLEGATGSLPQAHEACGRNSFRNVFRPDITYCARSVQYIKQTIEESRADVEIVEGTEESLSDRPSKEKVINVDETEGVCYLPKEKTYQVTYESPTSHHSIVGDGAERYVLDDSEERPAVAQDDPARTPAADDRYTSSSESQTMTAPKRRRKRRRTKKKKVETKDGKVGGSSDESASLGISEERGSSSVSVTTLPERSADAKAFAAMLKTRDSPADDSQRRRGRPLQSGHSSLSLSSADDRASDRGARMTRVSSKSLTKRSSTNSVVGVLGAIVTRVSQLFHSDREQSLEPLKTSVSDLEGDERPALETDLGHPSFMTRTGEEETMVMPPEVESLQVAPAEPVSEVPISREVPQEVLVSEEVLISEEVPLLKAEQMSEEAPERVPTSKEVLFEDGKSSAGVKPIVDEEMPEGVVSDGPLLKSGKTAESQIEQGDGEQVTDVVVEQERALPSDQSAASRELSVGVEGGDLPPREGVEADESTIPGSQPEAPASEEMAQHHSATSSEKSLPHVDPSTGSVGPSQSSTGRHSSSEITTAKKKSTGKARPSKKSTLSHHAPKKASSLLESTKTSPYSQPANLSIADFRPRKSGKGSSSSSKSLTSQRAVKASSTATQAPKKSATRAYKPPEGDKLKRPSGAEIQPSKLSTASRPQHRSTASVRSAKASSMVLDSEKKLSAASMRSQKKSSTSLEAVKSAGGSIVGTPRHSSGSVKAGRRVSSQKFHLQKSSRMSVKSSSSRHKETPDADGSTEDLSQPKTLSHDSASQKMSAPDIQTSKKSVTSVGSRGMSIAGACSQSRTDAEEPDIAPALPESEIVGAAGKSSTSLETLEKRSPSHVGSQRSALIQAVVEGIPQEASWAGKEISSSTSLGSQKARSTHVRPRHGSSSRVSSSADIKPRSSPSHRATQQKLSTSRHIVKKSSTSVGSRKASTSSVESKKSSNVILGGKVVATSDAEQGSSAGILPEFIDSQSGVQMTKREPTNQLTIAASKKSVDEDEDNDTSAAVPGKDLIDVRPSRDRLYSSHSTPSTSRKSLVEGELSGGQMIPPHGIPAIVVDTPVEDQVFEEAKCESSSTLQEVPLQSNVLSEEQHETPAVIVDPSADDQGTTEPIGGTASAHDAVPAPPEKSLASEPRASVEQIPQEIPAVIVDTADDQGTTEPKDQPADAPFSEPDMARTEKMEIDDEGIQKETSASLEVVDTMELKKEVEDGGSNETAGRMSPFERISLSELDTISESAPDRIEAAHPAKTSSSFEIIEASEVQDKSPGVEGVAAQVTIPAEDMKETPMPESVSADTAGSFPQPSGKSPEITSVSLVVPEVEISQVAESVDDATLLQASQASLRASRHASAAASKHASPRASEHASPTVSMPALARPSEHAEPSEASPRGSKQASPRTSLHASPMTSRQASPQTSVHASPEASKHTPPKSSIHASPRDPKHASPKSSIHATPNVSKPTPPETSPHASGRSSQRASPQTSVHVSPRVSNHASPTTSLHASPTVSKHASLVTSGKTSPRSSKHASPQTSFHASPRISKHASSQTSVHASPRASKHASPRTSVHASPKTSRHASPETSAHASPRSSKHPSRQTSVHASPKASKHAPSEASILATSSVSKHASPEPSVHASPRVSKQASHETSVHAPPEASEHAPPQTSVHASPSASKHASPRTSAHVSPRTSKHSSSESPVHASPEASELGPPQTSVHASTSASKHASPRTSAHVSPRTSKHASSECSVHASPWASRHASPKASLHASPQISDHASPRVSKHASLETSVHASRRASKHASPKTSVHASPRSSKHASPQTSVHASPRVSEHASPQTSVHVSPQSSQPTSPRTSFHASPRFSEHALPQTSVPAPPKASEPASPGRSIHPSPETSKHGSPPTSAHASPRVSKHASPETSVHAPPRSSEHVSPETSVPSSPRHSKHASPHASVHVSPRTSKPASPQTSVHVSPRASDHASHRTSVHASLRASKHQSPENYVHVSPETSKPTSPQKSVHASPRTSKHGSPETSLHASPKASEHASPQTPVHASPRPLKHASPAPSTPASPRSSMPTSPVQSNHAAQSGLPQSPPGSVSDQVGDKPTNIGPSGKTTPALETKQTRSMVSSILSFFKRQSAERMEVPRRSASEGTGMSPLNVTDKINLNGTTESDRTNPAETSRTQLSGRQSSNHSQERDQSVSPAANKNSPTTSLASIAKEPSNQSLSSANSKHSASSKASRSSKKSERSSKRSKKSSRSSVYEVPDG